MKQFSSNLMIVKIISWLSVFLVTDSLTAQTTSSGESSQFSGSGATEVDVRPMAPNAIMTKYPVANRKQNKPVTKAAGDLVQVTHNSTNTNYQSWNAAIDALQENDIITLLQDVELVWGDGNEPGFKMPKVSCTIQGTTNSIVLKSTSTLELEAPVTFKDITLNLKELVACGNPLSFDENITCTNGDMTICGGSGFYEEGVEIKSTSITIKSGTFPKVYGGGFYADVSGDTNIDIQGGSITVLYGGGLNGEVGGSSNITVDNNATVGWLYGGGYNAPVAGKANLKIKNGTIDYVYGGGELQPATCGNTDLTIEGGTFGQINEYRYNLMGGGDAAPVTGKAKVTISGGTFNCFVTAGGGQNSATTATCGNTELNITGGTFTKWTYGGGWSSPVLGTATVRVSGSPNLTTLCGGGAIATASCQNTDVTVSSGSVNWIFGGGENGTVTETAKLTLSGGTINGTACGGGSSTSALCGNTDVSIVSGNWNYVYAGGENGSVTGECHLAISGNPTITGSVFGGSKSKDATVGSTRVEISGGTFKNPDIQNLGGAIFAGGWGCTVTGNTSIIATGGTMGNLYGGCSQGSVEGSTYVEVNGATLDGGTDNGTPNSAAIYGGGFGDDYSDDGYDANLGKVGSTKVLVKNFTPGAGGVILYGGGLYACVTGNTDVTIENGTFFQVWGGSHTESTTGTQYQGTVGGDVNVLVKGGEISTLGAARDQIPGQPVPVDGNMNLTIEGGEITQQINSGNHPKGNGYKPCTLTIRNLGTESEPFRLPQTNAITHMILDNSTVTYRKPDAVTGAIILHAIRINKDYPMAISGNGKLTGDKIILSNFYTGSLPIDVPLVTGKEQLKDASFVANEGLIDGTLEGLSTLPVYKVGNTYRKTEKTDGDIVKAKIVTINQPSHGKLTVKWIESDRENILDSGDQVPVNTELTLSLAVNSGYQGGKIYVDNQPLSESTYTVTDDVTISAGDITKIPDPEPAPDPVPPVYYTVTLPRVEGVTTDPIAGNYEVEAWDSFRFYLTLDKEYDLSKPVLTTDRGETIQPRTSDGAYIIKYVRQPIVIKIDGVMKNPDPVANETVETNGIKIYAANGYLHIQTPQPEQIHIFTPDGRLLKAFRTSGDEERIALPKGIYLIRTANQGVKVVL